MGAHLMVLVDLAVLVCRRHLGLHQLSNRSCTRRMTAHLRRQFPQRAYVGIEVEVNQRIVLAAGRPWAALRRALIESFRNAGEP